MRAVRVDPQGYVWVVDKGSDMVVKIDPKPGHVVMVFGRRGESADPSAQAPEFAVRGMACPSESLIFADDETNWRVHRIVLHAD